MTRGVRPGSVGWLAEIMRRLTSSACCAPRRRVLDIMDWSRPGRRLRPGCRFALLLLGRAGRRVSLYYVQRTTSVMMHGTVP